jgi:hypothetical protein
VAAIVAQNVHKIKLHGELLAACSAHLACKLVLTQSDTHSFVFTFSAHNRGKDLQARFLGRDPITGKAMAALYDGENDQSINEVLVQEGTCLYTTTSSTTTYKQYLFNLCCC